jgi:hypothetical protein
MSDIDNKQDTTQDVKDTVVKEPVQKVEVDIDSLYKDNQEEFERKLKESKVWKDIVEPWKDSQVSQGINTFKVNKVPDLITKAVEEQRAEWEKGLKLSGEDKVRAELKAEIAEERKARLEAENKAIASEMLSKLNLKLGKLTIEDVIGKDKDATKEKINRLYETQEDFKKEIETKFKNEFIKDNNYVPPTGKNEAVPFGGDEKAWAAAIKAGKSPASGPEFMKINDAMNKFHGRK